MFKTSMDPFSGLFFPGNSETRVNSAIHMFFVNFNLAVFWLNRDNVVVDKVLAKKWYPLYVPRQNASHILELHESKISDFSVGDKFKIIYDA